MSDLSTGYIQVPPAELSPEAYQQVLEEFIGREGTDYGVVELSLEQKRDRLALQVERGEVVILFDFASNSCTLVTRDEAIRLQAEPGGSPS